MIPFAKVEILNDATWVDVTSDVVGFTIKRGRSRDLDAFQAGNCNVQFYNRNDKFTPQNTNSPIYNALKPMNQMRLKAVVNGTEYQLFQGYTQDFNVDFSDAGITSFATISCVDAFTIIANQELNTISASYDGDLPGTRITRVLDLPEVDFPASLRSIDSGSSILGPTTFGQNVLQYLQTVEQSEVGSLFVSKDGKLTFKARNSNSSSTSAVFSDKYIDANSIFYSNINLSFNTQLLYNRIRVEGTSGNIKTSEDASSKTKYQVRTLSRTNLFNSDDSDVQSQADYLLGRFKEPEFRITDIEMQLSNKTNAHQALLLSLELANKVKIQKTMPSGMFISQNAVIDSLEWRFVTGTAFDLKIGVSTGAFLSPFRLDDAFDGILDTSILAY